MSTNRRTFVGGMSAAALLASTRVAFAQKKYGYSKEVMEEAYKYLIDALAQDGFVDDSSLQAAIDETKSLAKITKSVSQSDVVDYNFLRAATKK